MEDRARFEGWEAPAALPLLNGSNHGKSLVLLREVMCAVAARLATMRCAGTITGNRDRSG